MPYQVIIKRTAEKELDAQVRNRIGKRLLKLEDDPRPQGVKKLRERIRFDCVWGIIAYSTL